MISAPAQKIYHDHDDGDDGHDDIDHGGHVDDDDAW